VGTYLHGSLASGSYHHPKSDVDLLFVVDRELSVDRRRRFARAAARAHRDRPMLGGLECTVVRRSVLADRPHPAPIEVSFAEGDLDAVDADRMDHSSAPLNSDLAAHVQALCEFGVALEGPPVSDIFSPYPRADFLDSIRADWAWILEDEHIIESPFYGVLNIARGLWVLEAVSTRLAPSKDEAGEWLRDRVPHELTAVVERALEVYRDDSDVDPGSRRTGGRTWSRAALLQFRDWARTRMGPLDAGP
jgi:streptomycin 3"-adenylyltransferase